MKTLAVCIVAALALAGCSTQTATVEQSTSPAAGAEPLAFPAHNMAEFDAAMGEADDYCYKQNDLRRAHYVDRTFETARFECAPR
jgi:PBP1b-binding outer membrane lipoprotein LpoB